LQVANVARQNVLFALRRQIEVALQKIKITPRIIDVGVPKHHEPHRAFCCNVDGDDLGGVLVDDRPSGFIAAVPKDFF
jgi:hypothetical protein